MKISTKTRYGLRFMVALGKKREKRTIQLSEIAASEEISEKYLSQIVIPLKNSGLIISSRGAKGGYSLGKPAESITVLEIMEILEGPLFPVDCLKGPEQCNREKFCVTQSVWEKMKASVTETLSQITLAQLIEDAAQKSEINNYII